MRSRRHLVLPALLLGLLSCGKEVGRVAVDLAGTTATKSVTLPGGARALFPVHADSYSYSGANYVLLRVELLRADAVVATVDCRGFEIESGSGGGCGGVMHLNSDCAADVPDGGADAVRVSARLEHPENEASFEGLAVGVRIKEK